ncbi:MAG: crossover junction endodeoxyribonuclease RuvC [Myxococcales bacterium]|nr:crossover junction endodeoxyribonuclease RuvC [Myxococcales bacterium]
MRVLGIDPGSACTGYGVLQSESGRCRLIEAGVIRAPRGDLGRRLQCVYERLQTVIAEHRPEAAALEEVFAARNARSALVLGHARGVALLAARLADVPVFAYAARTVKKTVAGSGAADKRAVQRALRLQLQDVPEQLDASDAVALALCHLAWCRAPRRGQR